MTDPYLELLARQEAGKGKRRPPRHEESQTQRQCVAWFRLQYPKHAKLLFAVPNGGARSRVEAAIMKAEGVTAGVSDLILLEPRGGYGALCIEMKREDKSSRQSARQKEWQAVATEAGNRYVVVRSLEIFQAVVNEYMQLPPGSARVTIRGTDISGMLSNETKFKY